MHLKTLGDSIKLHYLENKDELRKSKKNGLHEKYILKQIISKLCIKIVI